MARKTASRIAKRKEVEAAVALDDGEKPKKKTATRKKAPTRSRAKKDSVERRELVWAIFSSTMKEEARFKYNEKKLANEKLEALRAKSKKTYFMQPIKEPITTLLPEEIEAEEKKAAKKKAASQKKATAKKKKAPAKKKAARKKK